MTALTPKENEVLLTLFKEFNQDYNSNSLSKRIGITPRGTLKILKSLHEKRLLVSKQFGKAVFYKVDLNDYYAFRTIETLLIQDARENASRWLAEFKEIFSHIDIAVVFGSITKEARKANDIDLLLVFPQKEMQTVKRSIENKNKVLTKPIDPIFQSRKDLKENMKKKDGVILNILRQGHILHGYDKLIEIVRDTQEL